MDDIFGLSMNLLMFVLLGVLAAAVGSIAYVALRNRIMFAMGIRNIPRRPAQTVLIVVGLMLSTVIISAAFTTGDTVEHSLTRQAYDMLGSGDEWLSREGEGENAPADVNSTMSEEVVEQARSAVTADPNIDGFLPVLLEQIPVVDPRSRQSEPSVNFVGADVTSMDGFTGDVVSLETGEVVDIASLGDDEVFMNESAADDLDAQTGDTLEVYVAGQPHTFTVADVVEDRLVTGIGDFDQRQGMVTRLDRLQELFGQPGEVTFIAVSNAGDEREGLALTEDVVEAIEPSAAALGLEVYDVKRDLVDGFEEAGAFMTTFFLLLGLFSIAAGMLLIVMIFVMLAAERRSELGMARAVGTKRGHLIQMFMSEGMAYNMLSAMVGAGLGVAVAFLIANVMARIFGDFFDIEPYATWRSLVISYSLGVSLTFVTVTFSSWRASNLNIVAAIRDIAEQKVPNPEHGKLSGFLRGLLNATVALTTFPVALFVYLLRGHSFSYPKADRTADEGIPIWPIIVLPLAPFYLTALGLIWLVRDRRPSNMPVWLVGLGIVLPPVGLVLVALQDRDRPIAWSAGFAVLGIVIGALLVMQGLAGDVAFPFALGFTLIAFGAALTLQYFGAPPRPVFTFAGVFLLVFWGLTAGQRLEWLFGTLSGDEEMFFLSGVAMVASSTMVLIYNADLVLAGVTRVGVAFGPILPAVRTAVAYPLANKFRTGMTVAMISLVIFALTMMSTMNTNFGRLFLADDARGGWDVTVEENPNNPIDDLGATLEAEGSDVAEGFRAVGKLSISGEAEAAEIVAGVAEQDYSKYPVIGVDEGFVLGGDIPLSARAEGFANDRQVWQALARGDNVAVVDGFTVGEGGFDFGGESLHISAIDEEASTFEPVPLVIRDPIAGSPPPQEIQVIGVIEFGSSASFFGVYISEDMFGRVFGDPLLSMHVVGLDDPGEAKDVAREVEGTLLSTGAQAESLKEQIEDDQALTRNFFLLMQGFMGLGLFVGIAAVGVIAFRTVVERRQQIGMLRAIGYQRSTVALSFIMESSFVSLLGIASGVGLAIWLSFFLLTSDEFPDSDVGYAIPWLQIIFISGLSFFASLLMTFIPSRQAASIPTAEALRYE